VNRSHRPAGQVVARVASAPGTSGANVARFTLENIPSQTRPLTDFYGHPLQNADNTVVGNVAPGSGTVPQWMDSALATGWAQYAQSQIQLAAANQDPIALKNAAHGVMQYFNSINIPWMIDPVSRFLSQAWFTGPPDPHGPPLASEFAASTRYNNTVWLAPHQTRCIIVPGTGIFGINSYGGCNSDDSDTDSAPGPIVNYSGTIPNAARRVFSRCFTDPTNALTHPTQILPRMQFLLRVPPAYTKIPSPSAWSNDNAPQVFDLGLLTSPTAYNDFVWQSEAKQFYRAADCSDRTAAPEGWDTYAFDSNWVGSGGTVGNPAEPEQLRPSYADYLPWLQAWVASIVSRTPEQVVLDSRGYALWRNMRTAQAAGGSLSALAGGAVATVTALSTTDPALGADLRGIGAMAGAVGAALSPATFGISGLIGGVVAALSSLAATVVPPNLQSVFIDDLERPKPWLERSWLEGSPFDLSQYGAPSALEVPAPPGWTRPVRNLTVALGVQDFAAVLQGLTASSDGSAIAPPATPSFFGITPAEALVGAVVLAVAAVGVYVATRPAPPPANPRTSRSSRVR